jgi:hypothetical protein
MQLRNAYKNLVRMPQGYTDLAHGKIILKRKFENLDSKC